MKSAGAEGHGYKAKPKKPQHTGGGNVKMSNEMRSDTHQKVSNKHPYPKGLS